VTTPGPTWVPLRLVQLAARMLPPAHRLRYEGEFTAELYGMTRTRQLRHAAQVLTRAFALRSALVSVPATAEREAMMFVPTVPLTCRLNLRHKWHQVSTEDGNSRTWECAICGRERPDRMKNAGFGAIGMP
jgi:hypothetical protein